MFKKIIKEKIKKNLNSSNSKFKFPLLYQGFSEEDIFKGIEILTSGQITMSKVTKNFEKNFAKKLGVKHAVMVNSGSSANLLSAFAGCNPMRKNIFRRGDEFIIPAVCWSTSLWPFVQAGLNPVFADSDVGTLNINIDDMEKKITKKTKVIVVVHVLGNASNIEYIRKICIKKKIILVEDTCESLGTKFKNKYLGTFGDFGTFSFYYSHQISAGEGGMVVCNNDDDYDILLSLRSHGWARNLIKQKQYEKKYKNLDNRFIFINSGFNLRPTEIQAAIAQSQFSRMDHIKSIKRFNHSSIINSVKTSRDWNNQFTFIEENINVSANWFGLSILINHPYIKKKHDFLRYLNKRGIENRPIISGNFINQPSFKLFNFKSNNTLIESQEIEDRGFFIGLDNKPIDQNKLEFVTNHLLKISEL
jgi:CDP-6-deoxy-D-xylo-4-hexulose-3-dehydrase